MPFWYGTPACDVVFGVVDLSVTRALISRNSVSRALWYCGNGGHVLRYTHVVCSISNNDAAELPVTCLTYLKNSYQLLCIFAKLRIACSCIFSYRVPYREAPSI